VRKPGDPKGHLLTSALIVLRFRSGSRLSGAVWPVSSVRISSRRAELWRNLSSKQSTAPALDSLEEKMKRDKFHHRVNADGTIDSICLSCFLTAARADIGSDFHGLEAAHQCDNKKPLFLTKNLAGAVQEP
jgi:hypothetical protein